METLGQFPATFERYYNDNFPLRTQTVKLYNNLCYYLLNDAYNSSLAAGKEKWIYFYDSALPSQTTINDYKRTAPLKQEDLAKIAEYLTYLQEETEKRGGKFYFMIAPNKNEIYPEYMLARIKVMDEISSLDQLETYLGEHTDISVINVKQPLLDGKGGR